MAPGGSSPSSSWARASWSVAVRLSCSCAGARLAGASGRPQFRRIPNVATAADLVERRFGRAEPDRLWVTDITEHPTREGKVYCAVVLDVFSRRVVGWSIDASQTAALVTNALGMAIEGRQPARLTLPFCSSSLRRRVVGPLFTNSVDSAST